LNGETDMRDSILVAKDPQSVKLNWHDFAILIALIVSAAAIRLAFMNGPFGSDDLTYLERAIEISKGIWSSANYNGALRYGFNIPAGLAIYLFGINVFAANLWPLLCSVAEIALVYITARHIWGRHAAMCAALVLILIPLHVGVATRIHADPVVAFFLTLSFVLFYFAEQARNRWLYFSTGLAMGLVFWTKEIAVVTVFSFLFYPLIWRRAERKWLYVIGGGFTMLVGHLILMYFVSGDPFHAFKVVLGQLTRGFIQGGTPSEDGVWYYFRYLFLDIKHTWLSGIVAAIAVVVVAHRWFKTKKIDAGTLYVWFWLVTLVGILSFMPVSISPIKFVMKQSNYLTLFLAPLALLAGYQISRLSTVPAMSLLAVMLGGGLFLSALGQQDYRVFTSNSRAVVEFARANPQSAIVGSVNNDNIATIYSYLYHDPGLATRVGDMASMRQPAPTHNANRNSATKDYAIRDRETMQWGSGAVNLEKAPRCWEEVKVLTPTGFGLGLNFLKLIVAFIDTLPERIQDRLKPPFERLLKPSPATVYRVDLADFWCGQNNGLRSKG
jgi:4-amino-4-deoxy-L-arabinose transferase-like glycosyltransferase